VGPIQEVGSDGDGLSLLNPPLSTSRLEISGLRRRFWAAQDGQKVIIQP
jgi:hypothetical protein